MARGDKKTNCLICGISLTDDNWSVSRQKINSGCCKKCDIEKTKKWVADHKEYRKEYEKNYVKNNIKKRRNALIKRKYNIDLETQDNLFLLQDGKCGICGRELNGTPNVDHDHVTGQVRGLLCRKCNTALGSFSDNIDILNNAISYLTKFKNLKKNP